MMKYSTVVQISHPYGGLKENEDIVAELIIELSRKFPEYLFISPIHAFSFTYKTEKKYQDGLDKCLWLLDQCDEMWVFGKYRESIGCMAEIEYCNEHHIYYQAINDNCLKIMAEPRKCCDCGLMEIDEQYAICNKSFVSQIYEKVCGKHGQE